MKYALEAEDVVKTYGRHKALNGLSLRVPTGAIFGLVGSNGAGKTTFMAVCAGLLRPRAGTIRLLDQGPFHPAMHAGRIALLPQDSRFPPHARIEELLAFYAELQGLAQEKIAPEVSRVLEWTHLEDRRKSAVRTLSHGMNRRLAIAQAFLGRPDLVLLDEPLSGLDPREAARIRALLEEHRGRQTILLSSHDLHDIEALCDHVAFVEHGRRIRQDSMEQVIRRGSTVTYAFDTPVSISDQLRTALPDATWTVGREGRELTVGFNAPLSPAAVNARILPVLLEEGAALLEIRRGSDLETEYLALSAPPPSLKADSIPEEEP